MKPDYPELPRLLHKDGDHLRVDDEAQFDAAIENGWTVLPVPPADVDDGDDKAGDGKKKKKAKK